MTDKLFDDFVKDKLKLYDSGAPMHVWERIRDKNKSDKKGFFFFRRYWLTGIALFTITGISYLTWNAVSKSGAGNKKSAHTQTLQIKQENKNQSSTEKNKKQQEPGHSEVSEKENNKTTPGIAAKNNIHTSTIENKKLQSAINEPSEIKLSSKKSFKKEYTTNQSGFNKIVTKKQSAIPPSKNSRGVTQQNTTEKSEKKEWFINFTHPAAFIKSGTAFKIGNVPQPNNKPTCPAIYGPRRNDLYVEVYGSPDYTFRSFSNSATLNGYVTQRKTTEDNRNGFSAGVRIAKNIGEKTLIKAGFNYSQINERLRIINENEKQITQIITIRTIIRAPGDTLFIRDTTYFEQTGTRFRTFYNRYRFIDLPIMFSYEFGNPDLLSFAINAGPVINITSFYKGSILDTGYNPIKITTARGNGANNWRHNIGIGFMGSIAVYKRINKSLQIFGEPYFRYNMKPVTQNSNFVNQRYFISGMQLGLRYNLHNERQRYR